MAPSFETDAATKPVLAIGTASEVSYAHTKIAGTIDPEGGNSNPLDSDPLPIYWELQYAPATEPEPRSWQSANPTSANNPITEADASSSTPITVEAEATGLQPGQDYNFRLVATYAGGLQEISGEGGFTTLAVAKPTVSIEEVTTSTDSSATLVGFVNPNAPKSTAELEALEAGSPAEAAEAADINAAFQTEWRFEFCVLSSSSCGSLSGEPVKAGNASVKVEIDATGLEPNKAYSVVLKASNSGGGNEAATEASPSFTTGALAPTVKAWAAGPISPTAADINAQVNPHNSPTTYWFEWGTQNCETSSCQALPASKDASAGEGPFFVYVLRHLEGLSPSTTYHFRVVAKSALGTTPGPDQAFTTAAPEPACTNAGMPGTGFLPDCRGYELVSPPEKNGQDVIPNSFKTFVAEDRNGVAFSGLGPFGDVKGTSVDVQYLSRRDPNAAANGWSTHSINPPGLGLHGLALYTGNLSSYYAFSPDLSTGIFTSWAPLTDAPNVAGISNLYRLGDLEADTQQTELLSASASPLNPSPATNPTGLGFRSVFDAASADLSHVIFQSPWNLAGDGGLLGEVGDLYEQTEDHGLRRVGRIPSGPATQCDDTVPGSECVDAPSAQAGISVFPGTGSSQYATGMISNDGSRILFKVPAGTEPGQIYMREDGQRTYQINASEAGAPSSGTAQLWGMSADGSRVFLTTGDALIDGDEDGSFDLYMYEVGKPVGSRLTLLSGAATNSSSVTQVVGASSDGHYVYFVSGGQYVAGEPGGNQGLYLWHDGAISYIGDFESANVAQPNTPTIGWERQSKTSRVASDGHRLLFTSTLDSGFAGRGGHPGYDTDGLCGGGGCKVLYLYDADSGRLTCASCNPGGPPTDDEHARNALTDVIPGVSAAFPTQHLSHALSEDGRHVFFSTAEALVEEDTNGIWDAYSYDVPTGTLHLISSGTDVSPSYFMDASPDGSDVFFVTRERLLGWDKDTSYDLYDARVEGGFPEPVPVPAPCDGESCLPSNPPAPPAAPVASRAPAPGNRKPPRRCPKRKKQVKRAGKARCVKKQKAKPQGKKRASTNRGAKR